MYNQTTPESKDPVLWELAKRRAAFKRHLTVYIIINLFFWIIWLTGSRHEFIRSGNTGLPWPVWPMLGWGIGLLFQYMNAYVSTGQSSTEKEYEKLKNENNRSQ